MILQVKSTLPGEKRGKLTLIRQNRSRHTWLCECDCGRTIIYSEAELKRIRSCGFCVSLAKKNHPESFIEKTSFLGQRFGKLMPIKNTRRKDSDGSILWECVCDCGTICYISAHQLTTGKSTSCFSCGDSIGNEIKSSHPKPNKAPSNGIGNPQRPSMRREKSEDKQEYIENSSVSINELPDASSEYREGKKKSVAVNTYERNPAARKLCINHYGTACFICGFDFGEIYGPDCEGMIHVHHLKMVSEADSEYVVDPINDLRPVCPNCHMVLHSKQVGCYAIEEVMAMLKERIVEEGVR